MSDSPAPARIDYAPRSWRRGWGKKYLAIAIIFILALAIAWKWATIQRFYATTQAWLWQRRAMNHALPPGTVVYSEDPKEIARLLADRNYYRPIKDGPVIYEPAALREMVAWRSGEMGETWDMRRDLGGLFLHSRATPGGKKFLVGMQAIPFCPRGINSARYVCIGSHALIPGGPGHFWEADTAYWGAESVVFNLKATDRLTIFAGQADPADPSHFDIGYLWNGQHGTIEGRVNRNGSIELKAAGIEVLTGNMILIYPNPLQAKKATTHSRSPAMSR